MIPNSFIKYGAAYEMKITLEFKFKDTDVILILLPTSLETLDKTELIIPSSKPQALLCLHAELTYWSTGLPF